MRLHRRFHRSLAAALAALALAAPSALAAPGYGYHATEGTSVEEQYLNSHGIGAPGPLEQTPPAVQATDAGFDGPAAAVGAAAAAGIIALISLGAPRLRVRIAP